MIKKESNKKEVIPYKRAFTILFILFIVTVFGLMIFSIEVIYYKEKYNQIVVNCDDFITSILDGQMDCMECCNLTSEYFQENFFDYAVKKIKEDMSNGKIE